MMKRGMIVLLLVLVVLPLASAEIFLNQPASLYNLGDVLQINATLKPVDDTTDFFTMNLLCSDTIILEPSETNTGNSTNSSSNETSPVEIIGSSSNVEIFRTPVILDKDDEKSFDIEILLKEPFLNGLYGACQIVAAYGPEKVVSQGFQISKGVDVSLEIEGVVFDPGNSVSVSGSAVKKNKVPLNGFVEVIVSGINLSVFGEVSEGEFSFEFIIPENTPSGNYNIIAKAYEKDKSGEIINEGSSAEVIEVTQIVEGIRIALSSQLVDPEGELSYTILLSDQADMVAIDDVSIRIYGPTDEIFEESLVKSEETNVFPIGSNYTPGDWSIEASYQDLKARKTINVNRLERASFEIVNNSLIVTNTGNIPYIRPIEVSIGGTSKIVDIELGVGESEELKLEAPDGNYNVEVNDGDVVSDLGTAFLTGRAIGVGSNGGILGGSYLWIWAIIILVLLVAVLYYARRAAKRKSFTGKGPYKEGSSSVIERGEKQSCSIIALKLNNLKQMGSNFSEAIDTALTEAKYQKAKIYTNGDYRLIVLCPRITGNKENSFEAVKVAKDMKSVLDEYNTKRTPKIDFGIGVNTGDMIVESKEGKFKFASVGNTLIIAKRAAEHSKGEVMISEGTHGRVLGAVKSEKIRSIGLWKVKRITDRAKHSNFIDNFVERQKKEKKK